MSANQAQIPVIQHKDKDIVQLQQNTNKVLRNINNQVSSSIGSINQSTIIGEVKSAFLTESEFQDQAGKNWVLCNGQDIAGSSYARLAKTTTAPVYVDSPINNALYLSASSVGFSTSSGSPQNVGIIISPPVAYSNEVWEIGLQSDGSGNASTVGIGGGAGADNSCYISLYRNGSAIALYQVRNFQGTAGGYNYEPSSSVRFFDQNPPIGTNTYEIYINTASGAGAAVCFYSMICARQVACGGENFFIRIN